MNLEGDNRASILVVDDEDPIKRLLHRLFTKSGYDCFMASDGLEALTILDREPVDVVITDIHMPRMDGIELARRVKEHYHSDVIMMTGFIKNITYKDAVAKGANDFVEKPFATEELKVRLERVLRERKTHAELKKSVKQIQAVLDGVINSLSLTVEARDPYTAGHQKRVAAIAVAIAERMALSDSQIKGIQMAGYIHDLGKIAVPAEILSKPSRLSEPEFNLLKNHPEVGYEILKDIDFPMPIAGIVYQHHERIDGSGYPRGLTGGDILLEAKIMAVADVVEAMSSHRPYRPSLGIDKAIEEISSRRAVAYDSDVVAACLEVIRKKASEFGWPVPA